MFPGWIGFSQWIKKEFGAYPKKEKLVELKRMNKAEREEHALFGLYLWERRKEKANREFGRRFRVKSEGDG